MRLHAPRVLLQDCPACHLVTIVHRSRGPLLEDPGRLVELEAAEQLGEGACAPRSFTSPIAESRASTAAASASERPATSRHNLACHLRAARAAGAPSTPSG